MIRLAVLAAVALTGVPLTGGWSATVAGAPSAQFNGVWKLRIAASGAYVISKGGQQLVLGKATFKGATVTFRDTSGPASCIGIKAIGSYTWSVVERKLRLKPVREPCAGRRFVLARTFAHIRNAPSA